jgi:hypothetical protein
LRVPFHLGEAIAGKVPEFFKRNLWFSSTVLISSVGILRFGPGSERFADM